MKKKKSQEEIERERELNRQRERAAKKKFHVVLKKRIEQLCKEQGDTYYELAYKSAIPMTSLAHIMSGKSTNPGIYMLLKLCDGLGITLKEFFDTPEFEEAIAESRDEK